MDENANVSEVRRGVDAPSSVCTLTRIIPDKWPAERLQWLWDHLVSQDYAFDDAVKVLGPQAFLGQLFNPAAEWYEVGDEGICAFMGICPKVNAFFHFAIWGELGLDVLLPLERQLFTDVFERHQLNRLTGMIPAFNKLAIRAATIAGFRYEGEMRKAFLKKGVYHNIHIYGLLRSEFYAREVKH